ncbi:gamma-glutamyltransferase [Methylotuvimicrobium sp. KM2]|uniref:gamma-glutamyltransferase n=1 Tax=Methylotuvimicrobium sp. KM2 TaxID=3133976 RepID=UPI003100C69D
MKSAKTPVVAVLAVFLTLSAMTGHATENKVAVASAHPLASHAALEMIDQGGNAFDAAVAISAVLAVVEPAGSGLGGGGFWLLRRASDGFETMLDGRETAPSAAHQDMYLDAEGKVIPKLSIDGPLSAGIPGVPAALVHLAEHYGKLSLSASLQPAIRYARDGFIVGPRYRRLLSFRLPQIKASPAAAAIFLDNGRIPDPGWTLRQPDLAKTLQRLAEFGAAGFYAGETAEKLLKSVKAAGGIWSQEDLDNYRVVERKPVKGTYRGIRITGAALPSAGGIGLVQALNILTEYDLTAIDAVTRKHLVIEALRRVYHDRALYLGDPDFIDVPVSRLINPDYAAGLRSSIRKDRPLPSVMLSGDIPEHAGGDNTTHFSVMDGEGNRVAATLSVNYPFGSGFVAEGTGVILNDEMDDFDSRPGAVNVYGLIGGLPNAIAPGKRMLSSMSPTFLEDDERIAVLGTPGGSRIISMVLLGILDFADGNGPDSWVSVPRYHHQYIPDAVQYEPGGLSSEELLGLEKMGHRFRETSYRYGDMQALQWHKQEGRFSAASDPRGEGLAVIRND